MFRARNERPSIWKSLESALRAGLALLAGAAMLACNASDALIPDNAVRFDPPAVYSRWWAMTQTCSGKSGDLTAVAWYRAPGSTVMLEGEPVSAYWSPSHNAIVIAEDLLEDAALVRHEMLHALIRRPGHPREDFLGPCAAILNCGKCAPWPVPPGYTVLPPDSLEVVSDAHVLAPEPDGQQWVALEIAVTNNRNRAIVVVAPGDPVTPQTFAFDFRGPTGAGVSSWEIASDSSTLYFAPFATRRWRYEFRAASPLGRYRIPIGQSLLRGAYAGVWTSYDTVVTSP